MVQINPSLSIDDSEVHLDFIRASGPGGQNVNKVATAVQLRIDIRNSPSLSKEVKQRLIKLVGNRMTEEGILIIEAKRYRTQEQNRLDALTRLVNLVQRSLEPPKIRKKTRPTLTARAARVDDKKRRAVIKRSRRYTEEE